VIGEPAHQVAIHSYPRQIAQLVDMYVHYDPVLEDQLEKVATPPF
jgi:hypothetical protein